MEKQEKYYYFLVEKVSFLELCLRLFLSYFFIFIDHKFKTAQTGSSAIHFLQFANQNKKWEKIFS